MAEIGVIPFFKCSECNKIHPRTTEYFAKTSDKKYFFRFCKECKNKKAREWRKTKDPNVLKAKANNYYLKNRDKIISLNKQYYQKNKEARIQQKSKYKKENKDLYNAAGRRRYWLNPKTKIESCFRTLLSRSLKDKNGQCWSKLVGYTLSELMQHLEAQFIQGMTWNNYGDWHVDHIKPRRIFNYTSYEDEAFKQCWSLSNLRPLWKQDNIRRNYGSTSV